MDLKMKRKIKTNERRKTKEEKQKGIREKVENVKRGKRALECQA